MTAAPFTIPQSLERTRLRIYLIQMLLDGAMLLAGFAFSTWLYLGSPFDDAVWGSAQLALPLFWTVALLNRTYGVQALIAPEYGVQRATIGLLFTGMLVVVLLFLARSSLLLSRFGFGLGCVSALLLIVWARYNFEPLIRRLVGPSAINFLLIDDGGPRVNLADCHRVAADRLGIAPQRDNPELLDRLARLIGPMDRVVVSCPPERQHAWAMILKGGHMRGEIISSSVDSLGIIGTARVGALGTLVVASGPLGLRARMLKRALDLAISIPALLLFAMPMLLIAIIIRLEDGGSPLFIQRRVGRNNQFFDIYKFRTMRPADSDNAGARSVSCNDDRVTRIGRLLRRTSIDELPQLFNVLKGEMSLVGPRPHALGSQAGNKLFWQVDDRYWQRHALKPGLSGLAQIRGFRGETREEADLTKRLQADLEYQEGWTLWRDIVIILRTLRVVAHERAY